MITIGRNKWSARRFGMAGLTGGLLALGVAGCKSKETTAPIVGPDGGDPAAANMAQPYTGGGAGGYNSASSSAASANTGGKVRVLSSQESYQGQANGQDYSDPYGQGNAAPIIRQAPAGYVGDPNAAQGGYDQGYSDAEEAGEQAIAETDQAPPPLPEYDQPPAPDPNYLWTPGYYDYASQGYYWVPGAWVAPPFYGALWTPAWWGFNSGHYRFHRGYWGPHVGFYGGINYGFGYIGTGYYGGYWRGHDFLYNRAVTNVNVANVRNVYDRPVVFDHRTYGPRPDDRVAFNGGRGGIQAQPNSSELAAMHEAHYAPVAAQRDNRLAAASNRGQFVRTDGGRPAMAFAARPIGNAGAIGSVPREQPFNHPNLPGVTGRPEAGTAPSDGRGNVNGNHIVAGRGTAAPGATRQGTAGVQGNTGRPEEAGHGFAGNPGQGGFGNRQATPAGEARPGFATDRNAGGVAAGGFHGQGRSSGNVQREAGDNRTPAVQAAPAAPRNQTEPGGRFNSGTQHQFHGEQGRQAEPAQRSAPVTAFQRPAEPAQRQNAPAFHPEASHAGRPETAPMQQPAPRSAPQPAATPHPAPAASPHAGGGGGEHGGHH